MKTAPVYPAFLPFGSYVPLQVRLQITIGQDGHVTDAVPISGEPILHCAAGRVVLQYLSCRTLLNGRPVKVSTTVDIRFAHAG